MIIPVILCGGIGSRLWPLSRASLPKQFLKLNNCKHTIFQETILRVEEFIDNNLIIIANQDYRFNVIEQLNEINIHNADIILEPESKNTAPAITIAALFAEKKFSPDDILLILSSDHIINDNEEFLNTINLAYEIANNNELVTLGVQPTHPEIGYGYIAKGQNFLSGYKVLEFKEKPDLETATKYVDSGYLWNSGIFMFKVSAILQEIKNNLEQTYNYAKASLFHSSTDLDWIRIHPEYFANCNNISIDYAVLEKSQNVSTIPLISDWHDVGNFDALWKISAKDDEGNVVKGDVYTNDCDNCLILSSDKLVVANNVSNLAIVQTNDSILVSDKNNTQSIKDIVNILRIHNRDEVNNSSIEYRPWGSYSVIYSCNGFKVKHIKVKPNQKISLQMHNFRSEHWVIVKGDAKITREEEIFTLHKDQSVFIPKGKLHRIENITDSILEFIEVQTGEYLGEDDIIRVEDSYGRMEEKQKSLLMDEA